MARVKDNSLYMVVDLKNNELPLIVGNIEEISKYANIKPCVIRSRIAQAKRRNGKCKYIKIE